MLRLDKYICESTELTRNEAKKLLKMGLVTVDDSVVKNSAMKVHEDQIVAIEGEEISPRGLRYIMLHKPENFICSNVDEIHPSINHLIDLDKAFELNTVGRLDVDTTGLVLLSDDGKWSHQITSPKKSCPKCYQVVTATQISEEQIKLLEEGVLLRGEDEPTKPAKVEKVTDYQILLTISEGKYHQVKRMLAAVGNKVVELHRISIGSIELDSELEEGQWRYLTEEEIQSVF